MKKLIASLLAIFALGAFTASAVEIVRLDSREAAAYGASYVTIIKAADMASFTETNGTHGITSSVPAKVGLTMAGALLSTAFDDARGTASTNSILLTIGDGSDTDYYLASTQIAADSTEVFVQFAPLGAALTAQTLALTGTVQNVAVVTNIATSLQGQKYYSTAGTVVYTLTGAGGVIPSSLTAGELKIYWRELK